MGLASGKSAQPKPPDQDETHAAPGGNENRRFPRFPVKLAAHIRPSEEQSTLEPSPASTRNLSKGGAYIESNHQHNPGDRIVVDLEIPGHQKRFRITSVLRWTNSAEPIGMGVEFLEMSEKDRAALDAYVDDMLSAG